LQVNPAIAIKVHRVLHPTAGHELGHAHRAGVAATHAGGILAGALDQAEKLFQLVPEKRAAGRCARVLGREVESQCGQRIEHPKVAHVAAIQGFHPDHAHDQAGGHPGFGLGLVQPRAVALPEGLACLEPHRLNEAGAVGGPVFGGLAGGRAHELLHARQFAGLGQQGAHAVGIQPTAVCHVFGKQIGHRVVGIRAERFGCGLGRFFFNAFGVFCAGREGAGSD
jgi:hypothetical protein